MPGLRIADSDIERGELGLGLRLGRRIHPGERFDALAESSNDIGHHRLRLRLGFGREIALRVDLADRVAQKSVHHAHAALPARTLLRRAGKHLAEKSKALISERFWQHSRIGFDRHGKRASPSTSPAAWMLLTQTRR